MLADVETVALIKFVYLYHKIEMGKWINCTPLWFVIISACKENGEIKVEVIPVLEHIHKKWGLLHNTDTYPRSMLWISLGILPTHYVGKGYHAPPT